MRFLLVWVLLSHCLVAFSHILLLLFLPPSISPSLSLPLLHRDLPRRQPLLGAQAPLSLHPSWHLFCCRRLGLSLFPRLYRGGCCCSCFLSSKRRRDLPSLLLPYPHGWVCWYVMGLLLSSLPTYLITVCRHEINALHLWWLVHCGVSCQHLSFDHRRNSSRIVVQLVSLERKEQRFGVVETAGLKEGGRKGGGKG